MTRLKINKELMFFITFLIVAIATLMWINSITDTPIDWEGRNIK